MPNPSIEGTAKQLRGFASPFGQRQSGVHPAH
jgi:hypothetical protein